MKKLFTAAALLFIASALSAQSLQLLPFAGISDGTFQLNNVLKNDEHLQTSYEAGVDLKFKRGKHLTFTTGLEWTRQSYQLGPYWTEDNFDPLTGTVTGDPLTVNTISSGLRLPLKLGYEYVISPRLSVSISAGPSINYLIKTGGEYRGGGPGTITIPFDNTHHYFHSLSIGFVADLNVSYQFSKRFGLVASPTYAYIGNIGKQQGGYERFSLLGGRISAIINIRN